VLRGDLTRLVIGERVVVGDLVHLWCSGGVRIGDDTLVAAHTVISSQGHDVSAFAQGRLYRQTHQHAQVVIGRNVWIASNVTIGPGVSIGDNCVIAAGAVVLRSVPAHSLVAGVPAKVVRALGPQPGDQTSEGFSAT
jgi:maltose O-acetyltransferase